MRKTIEIPEYWDEMNPRQFKYLLKHVFVMMENRQINTKDLLLSFADYMCGSPVYIKPKKQEAYYLLLDNIANKLDWIFSTEDDDIVLNFDTTTNLLPYIGKLLGPVSHGSDLRFGEYRSACEFYNKYTVDHDQMSLDALVGILYRLPNKNISQQSFDGDYREPFNKHHIGIYAKRVSHIPEYVKWGVYLWFGYFCKYLMTGDFIIESNGVCFASLFSSGSDPDIKQDDSLGMTSVLFSLAESRTFGNIRETDNAFLFEVMMKMLNDKQQIDKLKKANK